MNWQINILILFFLVSCQKETALTVNMPAETNYLIEAEDLKQIINQEHIKLIDFRKKEFYSEAHIEGAFNIWRTDIIDSSFPFDGIMASKTQIESLFSKLGIKTSDTIIVYDDDGLCEASRLWWILQNYDFRNIKMFHGGLSAWKEIGGQLTKELPKLNPSKFKLPENSSMKYYVSSEKVKAAFHDETLILDTRSKDEFTGAYQKTGAFKAGRLPNSIHIDWTKAVNYNGDKRIKSIQDLEKIYNQLNVKKEEPIIVYCHSGVRSAHTTFVLTQLLGYKNVKNYDGSWAEWSYYSDLPYENDSITLTKN
jgi:thiosulfate/3-mercaptopyruvate sulfurtransferase